MEMLTHLVYFLISMVFVAVAWMIFVIANDALNNRIQNVLLREFAGILAAVSLFAVVGVILWQSGISFFIGIVLVSAILLVVYLGRKATFKLFNANT